MHTMKCQRVLPQGQGWRHCDAPATVMFTRDSGATPMCASCAGDLDYVSWGLNGGILYPRINLILPDGTVQRRVNLSKHHAKREAAINRVVEQAFQKERELVV